MDHSILLARLHDMFGIAGKVWFLSYLSDRIQAVSMGGSLHKRSFTTGFLKVYTWAQLFTLYIQRLSEAISQSRCGHYKFPDYTQLHQPSTPSDCYSPIVEYVDSVRRLMTVTCWSWTMTKVLSLGSHTRVSISQDNHLRVGNHDISFKGYVKNLGVHTDYSVHAEAYWPHQSFSISRDHISWRRKSLLSWRVLLFSVGWTTATLLFDNNCDQMYRLQKVQNHAAKLVFRKSRHEHVRPVIKALHWLSVKEKIIFMIAIFVFRFFDGTLSQYLSSCLSLYTLYRTLHSNSDEKRKKRKKKLLLVKNRNLRTFGSRFILCSGSPCLEQPSCSSHPTLQFFLTVQSFS